LSRTNVIIVDDFYTNPDEVREFALNQVFDVKGNHPGYRTRSFLTENIKETIQHILRPHGGQIIEWHAQDGLTGCFQYTTALDRSWIHSDNYNTWSGVCYSTPNAPHTAGTGLFRHKESGQYEHVTTDHESWDVTKWDLCDVIGNRYNRLVFYRGHLFHMSLDYFGTNKNDGRLFQVFFLNTEL